MSDTLRLLEISDQPLDVSRVYSALHDDAAGGVAVFVGTVRDEDADRPVTRLDYSAHPTATQVMHTLADEVAEMPGVVAVAATHRVGTLAVGDIAVVVGVACGHRGDAFEACHRLIDELKARVPIWKHQVFADGSDEWVGTP